MADGSSEVQMSKYLYKPGLKVVVGNTKHPHGKTALRHGPKASERFNGISVLDGEEVEILSVTDEYGSNEWTYVRRSTQEVGWLATRNLHTYGQGLPEPLAPGSYVLKRGMWATVGNVGEVGASAYLLDACPPSDSRNDLDLWHRQGQPIADEQVVQVAQIAETTSEWVQVKWHNCIGNAEKWILSRNLHVPADITVSQDTSATGDFATRVSLIRRIFMDCDADGNGVIDKSEFQGVFTRIGMTAKEVLLMFQQIDLDRSESIDIDEFLAWVFNTNCLDLIQKACTAAAPVKHRYDVEDIADAQYKPLLSFVDNPPHEDPLPCSHYLQEACAAAMPDVPLINRQVGEVSKIVQSIIAKPAVKEAMESYHVSKGMVFAIVMYTFDLCLVTLEAMERSQNFYYQLNVGLRSRRPEFLQSFHGYLYYLMTGLERLRPFAADCLYRGIDALGAPRIEKEYYPGRKIHFSGFSSATPPDSVREAINFAKQSGDGGLLLRIRLQASGSRCRDIRALSAFPSESEILLLPNFPSIVVGRPSYDKDLKFQVLDLQEVSDAKIEIF